MAASSTCISGHRYCSWTRELIGRLPHTVSACPSTTTFSLADPETGIEYLIDTGAARSLIPRRFVRGHHRRAAFTMQAANGSPIPTYGKKELPLNYGPKRYMWNFIVADVFMPIIGADFLYFFSLAVDVRHRALIPTSSTLLKPGVKIPQIPAASATDPFDALRAEFSDVFSSTLPRLNKKRHSIRHHIETRGPPVFARFRRLSPAKLEEAKRVFKDLERQGICQKAASPWSSPLHMVLKKDGLKHLSCGVYVCF